MRADRRGGAVALAVAVIVFTAVVCTAAAAQTSPRPSFALRPPTETEGWTLEVGVPRGWALYAPEAGPVGLPLTGRWTATGGEGNEARLTGPRPAQVAYPWGTARVHRGRVRFSVAPPGAPGDTLRVRWALCRPDLCVPGETPVLASGTTTAPGPSRPPAAPGDGP